MTFDIVVKILEVAALLLLVGTLVSSAAGLVLRERARGYRLPYEQPRHVRILRENEQ